MIRRSLIAAALCLLAGSASLSFGQRAGWSEEKFSMFIHYGLYSLFGGEFEGQPVREGYSEQILTFGVHFSDWYEAAAREFTAERFDADSIAALAKAAGMRSVVLTAKHHDGFCLFRTATTSYNSYDGAPARRDLVGEMAEACHRAGLGFGVYFSLIDWHYPYAVPYSSHNADPVTEPHHEYNIAQVRELLTGYGRIDEIWFDMGSLTEAQSEELYRLVHRLQPECMVSGRLGNDYADFAVMADNALPDYAMVMPWQTAASIFPETWGYRSWQDRSMPAEKKAEEKLGDLLRVVTSGGKYLLNIGPMGDGSVVPYEREVLLAMGEMLRRLPPEALTPKEPEAAKPLPKGTPLTPQNALPLYTHSSADYYASYRAVAGYRWSLSRPAKRLSLCYTEAEKGREILLDGAPLTLEGGTAEALRPDYTKVRAKGKWRKSPSRGLFGSFTPGNAPGEETASEWTDPLEEPLERHSGELYEITLTADEAMLLPVRLDFSDGVLVALNGDFADGAIQRTGDGSLTLLLPLRRGTNTLLLKSYNLTSDAGARLRLTPLKELTLYRKEITREKAGRTVEIRRPYLLPFAAPAHLYNLSVVSV